LEIYFTAGCSVESIFLYLFFLLYLKRSFLVCWYPNCPEKGTKIITDDDNDDDDDDDDDDDVVVVVIISA